MLWAARAAHNIRYVVMLCYEHDWLILMLTVTWF